MCKRHFNCLFQLEKKDIKFSHDTVTMESCHAYNCTKENKL